MTVGRHTDPTEEELSQATAQLRGLGAGGWLAVTEGQYYGRGKLSVMMVRELHATAEPWELALQKFLAARTQAITPKPEP